MTKNPNTDIHVRLTSEWRAALEKMAAEQCRSVQQQVAWLIKQALEAAERGDQGAG